MQAENLNMDEITDERRKAIERTVRTIEVGELKALGEELFPFHEHPWRETYFNFLAENAGATFHYATTDDRVHIIYCASQDKGMWFLPGSGRGPLQPTGLKIMKAILEAKGSAA